MDLDTFQALNRNSPAWKLLRAQTSPWILAFLHTAFKEDNHPFLPYFQLQVKLADFQRMNGGWAGGDTEEETAPIMEADFMDRAQSLIEAWVRNRWLRKYPDDNGEDQLALTFETNKAFQFVKSLQEREFVGTESRFKDIFRRLQELVEESREDPQAKIESLEAKIAELKAEIKAIEKTGRVTALNDTQIKERYYELTRSARELLDDFSEVEANFKKITQEIYKAQGESDLSKGSLLGQALDWLETLKEQDQGRSFYAFWEFLISSDRQDELKRLTRETLSVLAEREIEANDPLLPRLRSHLHRNGQKVLDSNQLLAEKLDRVISEQRLRERKRMRDTIGKIRKVAMETGGPAEGRNRFWQVEAEAALHFPMDRPLGEPPPEVVELEAPKNAEGAPETLDFQNLFDPNVVDRKRLVANIRSLLRNQEQAALSELVREYPLERGLAELLTYFAIASSHRSYHIHPETTVPIKLDAHENRVINVPEVIFTK